MPPTLEDKFSAPVLGEEAQKLISCNQKLQALGIDDTIALPRIVVIGDQSTGKSSLIEAISTIKVPKAANLCTRCPIAINLTSGDYPTSSWRCTVYIEERYAFDSKLRHRKASKTNPLGPWQLQNEIQVMMIKATADPKELCDLIYLAQQLLLNPNRDRNATFEIDGTSDCSEKFSPNTIRLDISAANWPNLSFVDLPGVIQSAGRGQPEYYAELVASLARVFSRDENNIIMLTLPINHDVSNSRSYSIIQQENAQSRTIAIFTKIDLARDEERRDCLERYFGEEVEEEFAYGHHMVMLANNTGLDEGEFFNQEPWSSLPQITQRHFGVRNLTSVLRSILFQKTSETLPTNLQKIQQHLAQVKSQLDAMPEPPDALELPYQLREQIYIFEGNAKQLFTSIRDPETSSSSSRSKLVQLMQTFGNQINKNRPTMVIKTAAESDELSQAERASTEGTCTDPVSIDAESDSAHRGALYPHQKQSSQKSNRPGTRVQRFRLEDIRYMNQQHYQSSVPGEIEPAAVEEMHRMGVQYWDKTFKDFMSNISKLVHDEVLQCIAGTFAKQKHLGLFAKIEEIVRAHLDCVVQEEWMFLDRVCDAEQKHPLTLNTESIKKAEMESLAQRRRVRAEVRLDIARTVQKVQNAGKKKVKEVTLEDLSPDPWDVEVQMAAKTRAYYNVASHRFVDSICQQIFAHLIPRCQADLVSHLKQELGLNDIPRNRATIVSLMSEDVEREAYRARLISEMERLNEGHAYIASVLGAANGPQSFGGTMDASIYPDAMMSDGTTILQPTSPTRISPGKRKAEDASSTSHGESPTKRNQIRDGATTISQLRTQAHVTLVDRSLSFEPEEECHDPNI